MNKVDRISAGLRFAPPRGTAHARSDIAFACLRRGFQHRRLLVSAEGHYCFTIIFTLFHLALYSPLCSFIQFINRSYKLLNWILWVWGFKLGFRDCPFDLLHGQSLYLSLFLLTLSHMGSTCSRLQLYSTVCYYCYSWFDTWRYNFIMDYEHMKLDVVHSSLNLVFLTATWFVTFTLLYLSLSPLILPHLGCPCSRLQLEPTWYYCVIVMWIITWRNNFIMDYEIMKLYVGH